MAASQQHGDHVVQTHEQVRSIPSISLAETFSRLTINPLPGLRMVNGLLIWSNWDKAILSLPHRLQSKRHWRGSVAQASTSSSSSTIALPLLTVTRTVSTPPCCLQLLIFHSGPLFWQ